VKSRDTALPWGGIHKGIQQGYSRSSTTRFSHQPFLATNLMPMTRYFEIKVKLRQSPPSLLGIVNQWKKNQITIDRGTRDEEER